MHGFRFEFAGHLDGHGVTAGRSRDGRIGELFLRLRHLLLHLANLLHHLGLIHVLNFLTAYPSRSAASSPASLSSPSFGFSALAATIVLIAMLRFVRLASV